MLRSFGVVLAIVGVGCGGWEVDSLASTAGNSATSTGAVAGTGGAGGSGGAATAGGAGGAESPYDCDPPSGVLTAIATEVVADTDLVEPVTLEVAPGDTERLFVVERAGRIRVIENGVLLPTPFLDLSAFVWTEAEAGLLGLAFHPNYQSNRRFFVYYARPTVNGAHLVEFQRSENDPNVANPIQVHDDPTLESQLGAIHLGGALKFGPHDAYLYLAAGDRSLDPEAAQDPSSLLGKILRLDMATLPYGIPPGNLAGGAPEVYHLGLRNPWRMSFDACTGDMYIGDVGALAWEEVNFAPFRGGPRNFGWPIFEGTACYPPTTVGCLPTGLTPPLIEHSHDAPLYMTLVVGGYVYRGTTLPELRGMYVYGSLGGVYGLRHDNNGTVTEWVDLSAGADVNSLVSFGEDGLGELYLVEYQPGRILKIVPP